MKTFSGVFDLVGKSSEGLKNMATTFDDKPVYQKIRPRRVIYGKQHYIKEYNVNDSNVCQFISQLKNNKYRDF